MHDDIVSAALAGFARGLGDFWPADLPAGSATPGLVDQAERLARGRPRQNGDAPGLRSIFDAVSLPGSVVPSGRHFVPFQPLRIHAAALFPATTVTGDRAGLRRSFAAEAAELNRRLGDSPLLLEGLLDSAMRAAWCVPADGYGPDCDVSRYDHARTVAAISACLAGGGAPFALIGGDLSGIQAFIYSLASSGAAKSLRARSFYVQLLTEAIARRVLLMLGLPAVNLLYAGGGGFQILASEKAARALPDIQADISCRLLVAHNAALGLALESVTVTPQQFDRFGEARDALGRKLNITKRRPFASIPAAELAAFLGQPAGHGGSQIDFCKVTGEDTPAGQEKSDFVLSLEELGITLRHASHMALLDVEPPPAEMARDWREALRMFGLSATLVDSANMGQLRLPSQGAARLARFAPEPEDPAGERRLQQLLADRDCQVFYYPFARLVPQDAGGVLMFDELADISQGLKRWAVLRVDVDNLGALFRSGFGEGASIARASSLSLALRLFFEGWLPNLAEPQPRYADDLRGRLYIQYAGGDDVFVVGAWDAIAEYALRIRESFRDFTCGNPSLTLSAGIALADANFPLYQAARMAGEAEDRSKLHVMDGRAKDAVCFLDEVLDWGTFNRVYALAVRLAHWCGEEHMAPRSLLQTLQQLHAQADQDRKRVTRKGGVKSLYTRATWLAAYQLTRVADSLSKRADAGDVVAVVEQIQRELVQPSAQTNAIALAARWAQYLIR